MTPTPPIPAAATAVSVPPVPPTTAAGGAFDLAGAVQDMFPALFAGGWLAHALAATALWLLLAAVLKILLLAWRQYGRRSSTEIDDILYFQLRRPLWATLLALMASDIADAVARGTSVDGRSAMAAAAWVVLQATELVVVVCVVWLATLLVEHGVVRALAALAGRTTNRYDDQLMPLVRLISRPLIWMIGILVALDLVGVSVRSLALIIGGTSFVLAFALKESLEDVFSGIMLFVDQPFEPNDVLSLEDGTICEVQRTALRTTHLYDAATHTVVIVPNRKLAAQKLTNLTRPSPDMKVVVRIDVAREADHDAVVARLKAAAEGHPWVVGDRDVKLAAMRARMDRLVWHGQIDDALTLLRETCRVDAEGDARAAVARLSKELLSLSSASHSWEQAGFSAGERKRLEHGMDTIEHCVGDVHRAVATWLLCVRLTYVVGNPMGLVPDAKERLVAEVERLRHGRAAATADDLRQVGVLVDDILGPALAHVREYGRFVREKASQALSNDFGEALIFLPRDLVDARQALYLAEGQERLFKHTEFGAGLVDVGTPDGGIPDLDAVNEYLRRYVEWSRKSDCLTDQVGALMREHREGSGRRLDELLLALHKWLAYDFMEIGPVWKYPSVVLASFDHGRQYELKCFVDDVRLAHYTRTGKVMEQLRLDILRQFNGLTPTVPFGSPILTVGLPEPLRADGSHAPGDPENGAAA